MSSRRTVGAAWERDVAQVMALKVCFVVGEEKVNYCGVKDYATRLSEALGQIGITADVTAPPTWEAMFMPYFRQLRERKYDIVHIQYPSIGYKWSLWPHLTGLFTRYTRSVATIHEYSALPKLHKLSTHIFRGSVSRLIFTTEFEAGEFRARLGKLGSAQQIVPIGSNVPTHPSELERNLNVMYFGQIRPDRGIEEFLSLAKLCFGLSRPFNFSVVGSIPKKHIDYYQAIRAKTPSGVRWLIDLDSKAVAKEMASSLAAYLPFPDGASYRRGSLLAAMANRLPVISRKGEATAPELLNGMMVADGAVQALARLDFIHAKPQEARIKALHARTLVRRFEWDEIATRHAEIYNEIADRPLQNHQMEQWLSAVVRHTTHSN